MATTVILPELTKDEWGIVKTLIDEKLEDMMPDSDMFLDVESCLLSMLNKVKILHEHGKEETIPETCGNCRHCGIFFGGNGNGGKFVTYGCRETHVVVEIDYRCPCGKFESTKKGVGGVTV
jgi:hypothetical protein